MSTFSGIIDEIQGISVDRFDNGNSNSSAFFLSHCHTDHLNGLDQEFFENLVASNRYLYCSSLTKLMLPFYLKFLNNDDRLNAAIVELKPCETIAVQFKGQSGRLDSVHVTSVPCGHCPGSVMFRFEYLDKSVLYTGDFRINPDDYSKLKPLHVEEGAHLIPRKFDRVYLDTTFLNKDYRWFPTRQQSAAEVYKLIKSTLSRDTVVCLLLSSYCGYESVFVDLSRRFNTKVHVMDCYSQLSRIEHLGQHITDNPNDSRIVAILHGNRGKLKGSYPGKCLIKIKLSAYAWKGLTGDGSDAIGKYNDKEEFWNVCYSTHSSYNETKAFLTYFKAKSVHACVAADADIRSKIDMLIGEIIQGEQQTALTENPMANYKSRFSNEPQKKFKSMYLSEDED